LSGYLAQGCFPGGTQRNWASYGAKVGPITDEQKYILADPQTSGGLLVAVSEDATATFEAFLKEQGMPVQSLGNLVTYTGGNRIEVR
jgi:selenide,water dikinase